MKKPGYADQNFWIRLIFMMLFWTILNIALSVFGILLLILTIVRFGSQYQPDMLNSAVMSLARFISQIFSFISFQTERKPFPFQAWPTSTAEEESE